MSESVASKPFLRDGGKFSEHPLVVAAEPVMNAQALLDDIRKFNARQARVERAAAAERERMNQAITACLIALCETIAFTERKKTA